jgi:DNA-binding MarR family transcriptional regulator
MTAEKVASSADRGWAGDLIEQGRQQWIHAGWVDDADPAALVGSVVRVQQIMLAMLDKSLAPFQLRFARYEVLLLLLFSREHSSPISRLARRMQVHSATMTSVLSRLEGQGMIRRLVNPDDGRGALAVLTPMGRVVLEGATRALRREVFSQPLLSPEDAEDLFDLLKKIRIHTGDFNQEGSGKRGHAKAVRGVKNGQLEFDPIAAGREDWKRAGWTESERNSGLAGSIFRVHQLMLTQLESVLRGFDLSFARFEALMILYFSRGHILSMGVLANRLQVHPASVTNVVKRLEAQGFISRVGNPRDGRSLVAELKQEGQQVVLKAREAISESVLADFGLTPPEVRLTFDLLRKIRQFAGDFSSR